MTQKEALIKELQGIPEAFLEELADFVQFLKAKAARQKSESALMSEPLLARDWQRPEEDEAWKDL